MRSNYKKIGDYIREVNIRNTDLSISKLVGVSMEKTFISSVANIIDTDMSVYKVLKKGQLACKLMSVGRDEKLPVDLYKEEEEAIVSSAYYVFEPIDTNILHPEYLFMWLCRPENDRYIGYISGGDVRGGISWDTFCEIPINVPSIEKQKEIIKEYNVVKDRIELNNKLIQKLEETVQAIYKQWFVDFEFPDENGKPYKSSGGEMEWSEELDCDIPHRWKNVRLSSLVQTQYGYTASAEFNNNGIKFLRITDISQDQIDWDSVPSCQLSKNELNKYLLKNGDIVIARTGATAGYAKRINKLNPKSVFASYLVRMVAIEESMNIFLGISVDSKKYREFILSNAEGSAQPQANATLMSEFPILKPSQEVITMLNQFIEPTLDQIEILQIQNTKLNQFKNLLLSKLATINE